MTDPRFDMLDELIEKERYIVDLLPETVPADTPGKYFDADDYFRIGPGARDLYGRFERVLIKLSCYYSFDLLAGMSWERDPSPDAVSAHVRRCTEGDRDYINILLNGGEAMVVLNGDDTYMIVCAPDERLRRILSAIAASEGLFFRPGVN